ncbi:Cloroperoxidase [Basidiobolus meristosporus CBS 931.73]|uniref:Cloroperoxidase n=1 Tax=Basidiobolus meristosporus CBS 931.73 TaxID=1314790 RepID=A0A1Y1XSX7_9FUNG|nr:Cloroperoxidase [Basidiobolus meristosporus CBS 931.73]|eukprot:ORX88838.1 Cloroperoxidase [Basidiobolus meristosporus CBS 931.73]
MREIRVVFGILLIGLLHASVSGTPNLHYWERPKGAIRGPCPVLNVLANHGYLPRSGANITVSQLRKGIDDVVHFNPLLREAFLGLVYTLYGRFGPSGLVLPSLRDLKRHNWLEHDFSLSRQDTYLGDPVNADPELLQQLEDASSDGETYTIEDFARLSNKRIKHSLENNPNVSYTPRTKLITQFEISLLLAAFGKGKKIDKQAVKDIFVHERLPKNFVRKDFLSSLKILATYTELAVRSKLLNPEI